MPNMEKRELVCLMGASLGTGNRGVSALGASLVNLVHELRPEAEPVLVVGNKDSGPFQAIVGGSRQNVTVINYRLSPKAALNQQLLWIGLLALLYRLIPIVGFRNWIAAKNPWIHAVKNARLVGEICGGDSFSDIYGLKRFVLRSLPTVIVLLIRGEVVLFPQTYGPFKTRIARGMAQWIVRRASAVLARDAESLKLARELGAVETRLRLCPDVAFTLPVVRPESPAIVPPLKERPGRCLIGVNISGLLYHGGYSGSNMFGLKLDYKAFIHQLVPMLLEAPENEILLVPHTFAPVGRVESDNGASLELQRSLPPELADRVHLVTRDYDQHEIKGVIGMCDFFIGSRMHACIGALSQGIPTAALAYSKKFLGVFKTVGMESAVIDGRDCDTAEALRWTKAAFENRDSVRDTLKQRVAQARKELFDTFGQLLRPEGKLKSPRMDTDGHG
ncbi:MAG: polysaccharide pyruvyl transferase family protein [Akkermansiaceae bacterium]|nr:polysaccharide pyruvyl transferase family protein [Verrucomicrobiales bacterium]